MESEMSIITIFSGSFCNENPIIEEVVERTGYKLITDKDVVAEANQRCNQENVIAQVKHGVNAMRMPVQDLESNWAYMIMATLAWNLKAWFGLLTPNRTRRTQIVKMEYRRFLNTFILIPCQIVHSGRKIIYRILGYNDALKDFFDTFERIRDLQFE